MCHYICTCVCVTCLCVHASDLDMYLCIVSSRMLLNSSSFHSYEVTSTKFSRNLIRELTISFFASVFLGFGTLFLLLTVGIYV